MSLVSMDTVFKEHKEDRQVAGFGVCDGVNSVNRAEVPRKSDVWPPTSVSAVPSCHLPCTASAAEQNKQAKVGALGGLE